jgi:hypothetical protein
VKQRIVLIDRSAGPSLVLSFRKPVEEILKQTPDLESLEVLRRVSGGRISGW